MKRVCIINSIICIPKHIFWLSSHSVYCIQPIGLEGYPDSTYIYTNLNNEIEKMSKMIYLIAKVSSVLLMIPAAAVTIVNYFVFDLKEDSYFLIARVTWVKLRDLIVVKGWSWHLTIFRLPFDWRTPLGYSIVTIVQFATLSVSLFCLTPALCLFIGTCWIFIAFTEDMKWQLSAFNIGDVQSMRNDKKTMRHFCYMVRFHSDVKQLSKRQKGM